MTNVNILVTLAVQCMVSLITNFFLVSYVAINDIYISKRKIRSMMGIKKI
jgi:hypothetical protein